MGEVEGAQSGLGGSRLAAGQRPQPIEHVARRVAGGSKLSSSESKPNASA